MKDSDRRNRYLHRTRGQWQVHCERYGLGPNAVPPYPSAPAQPLSDLIPGILLGEREKQEMMGVVVRNIPDPRRMFLPEDFPEGVYPWRRDETGIPPEMIRSLANFNRPPLPDAPPAPAPAQ